MKQTLLLALGILLCGHLLHAGQVTITVTEHYSETKDGTEVLGSSGGLKAAFATAGYSAEQINAITDLKIITGPNTYLLLTSTLQNGAPGNEAVTYPDCDYAIINSMASLERVDFSEAVVGGRADRFAPSQSFPRQAFNGNTTIKTFVFPPNLTNFDRGIFANSAIEGVIRIPKTVITVSGYSDTFQNCKGITAFEVEEGNTKLTAIDGVLYTLPDTTLLLYPAGKQDRTFSIPEGITTLATNAFGWNDYLEELTFSSTVARLEDTRNNAFMTSSTKVKEFHVAEGNPVFATTGGFLVNTTTGTLLTFPPGKTDETIVIDGSLVKNIPSGYFSYAVGTLKHIIFTEGVEKIGYTAFKIGNNVTSVLEYVELPSTLTAIDGEAFVGNKNLLQVICKAINPPTLAPNQIFRESNGKSVRLGVPAGSVAAYKASPWSISVSAGTNAFPADQIVPYYNIAVENGTCIQSASVANYSVRVDANEAPEGSAFSRWTSEPAAGFTNDKSPIGFFNMPASDITVTALFALKKPFTLIDAITSSGEAGIGGIVDIEAAPSKDDQLFRQWEILEGEGLILENPYSVATSFTMIDGPVTIAARYATAYMINITGGSAVLEAFEGQTISITADKKANQEFVNWTSDTPDIVFADDRSETTTFVMPAGEVTIRANFKTKESGIIEISRTENVPYMIYNLSGVAVAKGITNGENISVNGLSKGTYILKTNGIVTKIRIE
ncbi:hypothetical protein FACS189413_07840 [Bacteroidia bacterium]|nr:hypothetical protein FACS189413_07840 [Bacteroidia bacterium]